MPGEKKPSWSQVKRQLVSLTNEGLVALLRDLYELSKENRQFLQTRMGSAALARRGYEQRIDKALSPNVYTNTFARQDFLAAKRAVLEYVKAGADRGSVVELKLYHVETGTAFLAEYGGMDQRSFSALTWMFESAMVDLATMTPDAAAPLVGRAREVITLGGGVGWLFPETLRELLQKHVLSKLDL